MIKNEAIHNTRIVSELEKLAKKQKVGSRR